ncbi:carboxypeptidase M32 [Mesorhizobium sp. WSM4887]|uniref:carboxypeptidase M32 n=1 Tax=Mesorhizobium sp. WSM4887 TaxID=3038543 RepID=UPI002415D625|nr:carboxypeptidase M32 [Mesorhizobium sp. WSM4887]MDG4889747.1 carboxypeptidase M32 [Mesorhizobium sp. WSM4887]
MAYAHLMDRVGQMNDMLNAQSVLYWDARVTMPEAGNETRGRQLSTLSLLAHQLLVSVDTQRLLAKAESEVASLADSSVEKSMVRKVREAVDYNVAIPAELTRRRAELGSKGHFIWAKARAESDFSQFAPLLEEIVALNQEMAEAIGYEEHPYDALLYRYDPGERVSSLKPLFGRLREGISPLVNAIAQKEPPRVNFLERDFPIDKQRELSLILARSIGYDFKRGRLDTTLHPFEISFTRNDVRITTRYNQNYLPTSVFGTIHEVGHALYEQGVDPAFTRTPFATDLVGLYAVGGVSYGAHESQSRLWENFVGRSRQFWDVHFACAQEIFPAQLADVSAEDFWRAVNRVYPGPVRTNADELTYDFHIMLRTELEADLIDGSLRVRDLPEAWNAKVKEYLGVEVPNDSVGLLQDAHWSAGHMGNFANYSIGNVMAAQLFEVAGKDEALRTDLAKGRYDRLHGFLAENIHRHGRRYDRDELLMRATGRKLDPEPYIAYLNAKYAELYGL